MIDITIKILKTNNRWVKELSRVKYLVLFGGFQKNVRKGEKLALKFLYKFLKLSDKLHLPKTISSSNLVSGSRRDSYPTEHRSGFHVSCAYFCTPCNCSWKS